MGFHFCYAGGCHLSDGRVGESSHSHVWHLVGQRMPCHSNLLICIQRALQQLLPALSICILAVCLRSIREG